MNIAPLGKYIKTTYESDEFRNILDNLADSLYKTDADAQTAIENKLPYDLTAAIKQIAIEEGVALTNKSTVQKFLREIREALSGLPTVQIMLAFKPSSKMVGVIHDWFYRTYRKTVILDITVKPELVAGSVVSYNGKYYDYSLGKETEQLLGLTTANHG